MTQDDEFDRLAKEIPDPEYDELTPFEDQIVHLMLEAQSDATIASRLGIPESSVQRHVAAIFKKMETWTMAGPSKPIPKKG